MRQRCQLVGIGPRGYALRGTVGNTNKDHGKAEQRESLVKRQKGCAAGAKGCLRSTMSAIPCVTKKVGFDCPPKMRCNAICAGPR